MELIDIFILIFSIVFVLSVTAYHIIKKRNAKKQGKVYCSGCCDCCSGCSRASYER